jgi:hypothetical protein
MKATLIALAVVMSTASLGTSAHAAGCLRGAIIGGVAGHFAHHGWLGAGAGCLVGRHYGKRANPEMNSSGYSSSATVK